MKYSRTLSSSVDENCNALKRKKVLVVGSSGKTGQKVVEILKTKDVSLLCAVKDISKGRSLFGEESADISVIPCDISRDSLSKLANLVAGVDIVVCCASYSPNSSEFPDPLGAYKVDFIGVKRLIDACTDSGVSKFVLVSSLLTNGLYAGQLLNPQYLLLNSFGGILVWKREAEKYLQSQALMDYTIIRPGGLKDKTDTLPLLFGAADTLFGGAVSRSAVAEVVAAASFLPEASNKIVEIIASEKAVPISMAAGFSNV